VKPKSPFGDMLETELASLDKEPKGIQWPTQQELPKDHDLPNVNQEKKSRQKCVRYS